ncbi:MAG: flagellar basal-body rod protein FlgF [Ignavibacteriales bacterium]
MLRGIYTAGMGLQVQEKKMDVISNNLANVNTNGYKKDSAVFNSFNSILVKRINDYFVPSQPSNQVGDMSLSTDIGRIYTDYKQGNISNTGNNTDAAISGSDNSFFTVEISDDAGSVERYTRDGAFSLDSNGKLVTQEGYTVLGEDGPITLTSQSFTINDKGEIIENGELVGKLKIKTFKETNLLRKMGNNLISVEGEAEEKPFEGKVMQGFVEGSNVNSIKEMVDMISVVRSYEANQKVIKMHDEMLGRAVNDIPSLR